MDDLQWNEVEITISDKSIIMISARGETARVTSGKFGLLDRNKGTPNEIYLLFVSFANNQTVDKGRKMTVSRARDLLRSIFSIDKSPIELHGKQYKPSFKISIGDYKKNSGKGGTVSLAGADFEDEDDDAAEFLRNHPDNNK